MRQLTFGPLVSLLTPVVLALAWPASLSADEVSLTDGSRVLGEVLRLHDGKLEVDTAHMDVVKIDVEAIDRIETERPFQVDLYSGERLQGSIAIDGAELVVAGPDGEPRRLALTEVATFDQFDPSSWQRTTLYVSAGLNVVRGNSETSTYSVNAGGTYRQGRSTTAADLASTFTEQEAADDTRRTTLEVRQSFDLGHRWSARGRLSFESNNSSDLDLRTILGASAGYHLVSTPVHQLSADLGLSWISEEYVGLPADDELTALVGLAYQLDGSDLFFDNRFVAYPSFDDSRYRLQFDSTFRFDLWGDFDFSLNFFDRYDSSPPAEVEKNDYGLTVGLGWSH